VIVPGLTFTAAGRTKATIGAGTVPNYISQGFGFNTGDLLSIDTNAPAGTTYEKGFRISAAGALYGTTVQSASDSWVEGVRVTALGQVVYESANPTNFSSGNPITAAGNFSVN